MNQQEYETLEEKRKQSWQDMASANLASAQQVRMVPTETDLRQKALAMAIDYHRSVPGDVQATAARFLAFLKGETNV